MASLPPLLSRNAQGRDFTEMLRKCACPTHHWRDCGGGHNNMTEMATPLPDYRTPVGGEGPSSQGLDGAHLKPCLHYSDFQSVFSRPRKHQHHLGNCWKGTPSDTTQRCGLANGGFFIIIIYLFIWWCWVLVAACRIFLASCGIFLMSPPRNSEAGSSLRTSALVYTYRRRSFISAAADGAAAGLSGVVGGEAGAERPVS